MKKSVAIKRLQTEWLINRCRKEGSLTAFYYSDDVTDFMTEFFPDDREWWTRAIPTLRKRLNEMEKDGLLWSSWCGTGEGGFVNGWGVKRYKNWLPTDKFLNQGTGL